MTKQFHESLQHYDLPEFDHRWGRVRRGIEKECLRITPDGQFSLGPHPQALGSALTNPFITTDFAEPLLEFITPASTDIDKCLGLLENIHRFTLQHLDNQELFWVSSMPCPLSAEAEIPLAEYGSSNIGRMKNLYRRGLHNRYGSLMQIIAGLHYNFSMPEEFWAPFQAQCGDRQSLQDFRTDRYLHLIRNFHRFSWLLPYLFGASPATCKCFVEGRAHGLDAFDDDSLYLPDATCLRMGRLGYRSEAQKSLFVCYNQLQTYVDCLNQAIREPYPEYEAIGQQRDGEYLQINSNLLQLSNEFYSTIRPKRVAQSGERPLDALLKGGIEYIEVRALDLNPWLPLGIDAEQIRFLDSFLLHCLLAESPACDEREYAEIADNLAKVVEQGRNPDLMLSMGGQPVHLREWAGKLLGDIAHSANLLDASHGSTAHNNALQAQQAKVADASLTPSGMMLQQMRDRRQSFFEFSMERSRAVRDSLTQITLDSATLEKFTEAATQSLLEQQKIEAADDQSFDEFLAAWNAS